VGDVVQTSSDEETTGYREMVEAITDFGLIRLDSDGLILGWHGAMSEITGYAAGEVIGRSVSLLHPEGETQDVTRELEISASTGRFTAEGWRLRKDGERFWAAIDACSAATTARHLA
jgi:rsbT co-antagonist protein RsbR